MKCVSSERYFYLAVALALVMPQYTKAQSHVVSRFPADRAVGFNPDTHLVLTFPAPPKAGGSGQIRVFDAADHRLIDMLDMSIPASPDPTWRGQVPQRPTPGQPSPVSVDAQQKYQVTRIGGKYDFHFYPVIVRGNVATIYLHNNHLEYHHTYIVEIDPDVLTYGDGAHFGIGRGNIWTFTTKSAPPAANAARVVVAADGTGDFNTIQGAVDFVPDNPPHRVTIFVKDGTYEEIVYLHNKANLTIRGEDREKVRVGYGNNSIFNLGMRTPNSAFTVADSIGIHLINFSLSNYSSGQAGALSISGDKNILSHMNIIRSGDALQTRGALYVTDSTIIGEGDSIIGSGPFFCNRCELHSWGSYAWPRNPKGNHGYVFVNSTFDTPDDPSPLTGAGPVFLAKHTNDHGAVNWPYAEMVLINCRLKGLPPEGWSQLDGDTSNLHFWEYNSTDLDSGKPIDTSKRQPASKQLSIKSDAKTIADYSNPAFVLGGWTPMAEK